MNVTSLRRLNTEHRSLHSSPLPPHYLFPSSSATGNTADDLTQLTLLLAGPQGTPYSQGLWRLQLRFPEDYPRSPPKAVFRTGIWHPNVEEATGSVCVDTLKRDWRSHLTVRDVLITISCLLINPNPDSALNSSAEMKDAVAEAKQRGEEAGTKIKDDAEERPTAARKTSVQSSVQMKRLQTSSRQPSEDDASLQADAGESDDGEDDEASASKENDPSLSPSPVLLAPPSPRKTNLGKRPLSALPTPIDPDAEEVDLDQVADKLSSSARNIANNSSPTELSGGARKSPKLCERGSGVNSSGRLRDDLDEAALITPFCDDDANAMEARTLDQNKAKVACAAEGKENMTEANGERPKSSRVGKKSAAGLGVVARAAASRSVSSASTSSAGSGKGSKPRVGLKRL